MKQQHKLQPKLRFPEFEGGWKEFSFKEIFNFSTGKNIKQKEAAPHFETPCVRYGELYYMYKEVISNIINYTNLDKSELKFSEGDEILLPSAGEDPMDIGSASALTLKNVAIGRTINILKPKNKNVYSSIFASYYINQKLRIKISGLAKGVSISNVYNTDLQTLFIKLPSLPEQQKIADYLATIDNKINLLEEKKAQLALYKKAMMQKLFSQEIRFKPTQCHTEPVEVDIDEAYPEWEEKRLGELFIYKNGKSFENSLDENGDYFLISLNSIDINGELKKKHKRLSYTDNSLSKGDLVMVLSDVAHGNFLGLSAIIPNDNFVLNQRMAALKPITKDNIVLVRYFINYNQKYFKLKGQGSSQLNLSKGDVENFEVKIPSLPEQQKIADFLSAIDESIEKVTEQISQNQIFKKAMLQQMFV